MRRILFLVMVLTLLAGCQPAPTPTPEPSPTPPLVVIVTPSGNTPMPLRPTPPFDPERVAGRWLLDFRFAFTEGVRIRETDFMMTAGIDVDEYGQISGRGEFATMARHVGCDARVTGGGDFWALLSGQVIRHGNDLFFEVSLKPEDGLLEQSYLMYCPDYTEEYQSQLLWYALRTAKLNPFRIPVQAGAQTEVRAKITSLAVSELNWQLLATITVSR